MPESKTVAKQGASGNAGKQALDTSAPAVAYYDELLRSTPGLIERTKDQLWQRLEDARFVFGGRMLSPYLRPHFVTRLQFDHIASICNRFWGAVSKVGDIAIADTKVQDYLGLTEPERKLIATDPKFRGVSRLSRLDSFLTDDSYKFVELNAETPAGVAYADVASEIFTDLEAMKLFGQKYRLSPLWGRQQLLDALLSAYREFSGGGKKPQIAIVDYAGLPTQREFELVRDFFEAKGYRTIIADPRELNFANGRLRKDDFEIDIVYKRLLINEFLEKLDLCRDLYEAYQSQAICMVNNCRGKLVHKKQLFGVLTDEQFAHIFTDEEKALIREHVPWTRRMEERKTKYYDKDIDLVKFVKDNRDQLVLKPNDDYGGHGIFIGWQSSAAEWDNAMHAAMKGDYLVQERVTTSRETFPYVSDDGSVVFAEQLVDLDPFLYDGKVGGAFTRLSTSELANVTAGGGMVPVFIIEGHN
jgi:uncharacterized circularly permuted ATP-grasp superfamily protein